jgi:aminopeptidase YwaD
MKVVIKRARRRPQHIRGREEQQAEREQSEAPQASAAAAYRSATGWRARVGPPALAALAALLVSAGTPFVSGGTPWVVAGASVAWAQANVPAPSDGPPQEGRSAAGATAARRHAAGSQAAITAGEIHDIVAVLAHDSLEGRAAGTPGAERAAAYIAGQFAVLGLRAPEGGYLQAFDLPTRLRPGPRNRLSYAAGGHGMAGASGSFQPQIEFAPLELSATGAASGPLRLDAGSPGAKGDRDTGLSGAVVLSAPALGEDTAQLHQRIERLEKAGAAAVLVFSDLTSGALAGGPPRAPAAIPVVALGFPAAERLARAAGIDIVAFVHGAAVLGPVPVEVSLEVDLVRERATAANVIGILDGADPALAGEAILIGAHYDHLGWGGPGSLAPGERAIHNGADDNASGVAGILELAGRFAADPPRRTLVFVAFGAEELGNVGSGHYVTSPAWPLDRTLAMLNLDMVGRLRESLTVYGTGTSPVWPEILDAVEQAGDGPGLRLTRVPDGFGPSDHASFYAARIPVLALFTGAHEDYHRPSDDVETIDPAGEARVLELAAAVVASLAGSDRAVPYAEAPVTERRATAFRVALGTLPDYAFAGPGVRLSSVRPGGPAARAGLEAGDVILRLDGREVADVYGYTAVLAELEAGRAVELVYSRAGETSTVAVTPEAR